jgi:voltage-gated potassium channel
MLGGVVSFGAVSGKIASVLVERQQKRNRGFAQLKKKRDHLVLCGWKPEMESIIAGILASNPDMTPSDIVLVTGAPKAVLFPVLSNR